MGVSTTDQEHNFGTVKYQYYPNRTPIYDVKIAYTVRKVMDTQIGGFRFSKRIYLNNDSIYLLNGRKGS